MSSSSRILKNIKNAKELELRQKALRYANLNNSKTALNCLNKAIQINPQGAYSYYLRGRIKGDLTYFEEGIKDLSNAIELDNSFADAYSERGNIKVKLGFKTGNEELMKEGIKDLDKAVDLNPSPEELIDIYRFRGRGKFLLKKFDEALLDLNKVLEAEPYNIDTAETIYLCKMQEIKGGRCSYCNKEIENFDVNKNALTPTVNKYGQIDLSHPPILICDECSQKMRDTWEKT